MDFVGFNVVSFVSEECSYVPDDLRKKLEESLEKIIDMLKCEYEQKISSLEKSVLQMQEENYSDKLMEADLKIENLTEEVKTLQLSCERLEDEKQELQKQTDDAVGKYESLGNMIRNYDMQINHWREKCKTINADFEKLNCDYCDVIDKYMAHKGLDVDYNKRLAEAQSEWDNLSKEIRHLRAEVDNLTTELTVVKDESKNEKEALNSQLAVKTSELNTRQQCIDELKQKIEKDDKIIEKLSLKLKDEREDRIKQMEALEREIQEQAKVAQIYKQRILDEESKFGDVAEGHKELLELIKYGEKRCKSLESELWKADYNCRKHEENVKKLETEVDRLNAELAISRSENVARSIDELYPMIGAGRQLLKNDISFTEMLRQYSKASDEIFSLKEENMTLKHSIDRIAKEIEAKAPYLRLQKEEYTKALQTIDEQVGQVDEIKAALVCAEKEKKESENDRRMCESVVMDLSKQVQYLTAQLESTRRGMFANKVKYPQSIEDGNQVEIIFGSIEELQAKNVKLLKKIKIMSEKEIELQEEIAHIQQINEETLLKQQEKYRQIELAVDEYKEISNNLRQQLKVYQNMYKNKLDNKLGDVPFAIPETTIGMQTDLTFCDVENLLKGKISAEQIAKDLHEKADLIEKERLESAKQLEELRLDLCQARSMNSMLRAELDHAKETFMSLSDTKDVFKKQITLLENQCKEYSTIFVEHEKDIQSLKASVKVEHEACLRQMDSLHNLQREYMDLLEKEKRLRSEYEQLKQCDTILSVINANIEAMKVNAEKKITESQEQLGTDMSSAMEECSVLRRLLQDKHKELDKLLIEKEDAVKLQLELEEKFNEELGAARKEIDRQCIEISSLKNSLNECGLQRSMFMEEKEKLQHELATKNIDLKEYAVLCEEYQARLSNLTTEFENYKHDAVSEVREELSLEISELKEKLLKLEQQKETESISQEIVQKQEKLKSQEETFESILELGKQMKVDKELSMHSEAMVELMKDVTIKSDEIVKQKAEIERAYSDLAEMKKDFKHKEKNWENECAQLQQLVASLEAKNSLLCDQLKVFDSQQLAPKEMQSAEPGVMMISEVATITTFESKPLVCNDEYSERVEEIQQDVDTTEVFSSEDTSKPEPNNCEVDLTSRDADECAVVDEQPYAADMGEMDHSVSVITAPQGIRTSNGRRRASRRKSSNNRKRCGVGAVLEPPILLTFKKKTVTTLNTTEETFQVNMPESFEVLDDNPHYSAISHTAAEEEGDNGGISHIAEHRTTMDFRGEDELEHNFGVEQGDGVDSPRSEEARDFTVLQPMPPTFEYITELAAPEEIDLTIDRESPHPVHQTPQGKQQQSALGRSSSSRSVRGSGTARRSRGTFKSQRKRSSSVDEHPSSSTKISRRK